MIFEAGSAAAPMSFVAICEDPGNGLRAEKLDESLLIIDGLWQGQPVTFAGRHYQVSLLTILPQPVQRPRVPIWTAAG
jgi:alkanesulfonate monooxygenase SsuD/methylene tetrahydromethanopterin reductase-like flavin-dependent oxidoreductase (luciferase family)